MRHYPCRKKRGKRLCLVVKRAQVLPLVGFAQRIRSYCFHAELQEAASALAEIIHELLVQKLPVKGCVCRPLDLEAALAEPFGYCKELAWREALVREIDYLHLVFLCVQRYCVKHFVHRVALYRRRHRAGSFSFRSVLFRVDEQRLSVVCLVRAAETAAEIAAEIHKRGHFRRISRQVEHFRYFGRVAEVKAASCRRELERVNEPVCIKAGALHNAFVHVDELGHVCSIAPALNVLHERHDGIFALVVRHEVYELEK
ncbi:Uncharacterised protein [uncultured archaeon]|nr:Uncharacterised protein [uncultured archaeon]